jgi:hypothetical protein
MQNVVSGHVFHFRKLTNSLMLWSPNLIAIRLFFNSSASINVSEIWNHFSDLSSRI